MAQALGLSPIRLRSLAWGRAGRVVTGVAVPFTVGAATGHLPDGAFAALGALPAGFVSFQGARHSRLRAIAWASLAIAISTSAGGVLVKAAPWAPVPAVALLGYGAGLLVSAGIRYTVIGLQAAVALAVAYPSPWHQPGPPSVSPWPTWSRRADRIRAFLGALAASFSDREPGTAQHIEVFDRGVAAVLDEVARALSAPGWYHFRPY